jgi:putative spermidine/putrescine transport system substrate-binding protein
MSQSESTTATPVTDASPAETSRRGFSLKTAARAAALAITGFPGVHASEKIVLRYLGTAVNQDKAIAEKFKADTGIKIQYVP